MLASIRVKNFALVEDTEIQLEKGFTVFTGETGAGKSLLLNAIVLLLGNRASASWVRKGALKAEVEGQFYFPKDKERLKRLADMGYELDDLSDPLVVRREFASAEGTVSRIWIQGKAATRAQLQEALGDLIEVSGQHEFLRLNKPNYILEIIDSLLENPKVLTQYKESYEELKKLHTERSKLDLLSIDNLDFLKVEVSELKDICKSKDLANYEEDLERQARELSSREKILEQIEKCVLLLDGSAGADAAGISELLRVLDKESRKLGQLTSADHLAEKLDQVSVLLSDFESALLKVKDSFSDTNFDEVEIVETLSKLKRLKRKYSVLDASEFYALCEAKAEELDQLENLSERREVLDQKILKQKEDLAKKAKALSAARNKLIPSFVSKWEKGVRELGMPHAVFSLKLVATPDFTSIGQDQVELLFSSNKGHELMPLAKVASGGELSRILLSLKEYVAQSVSVGVYLFDEVDTGIGGETAHIVGKKLAMLAKASQVLVVTHLAQIAAFADEQVLVEKKHASQSSRTELRVLTKEERLSELARMLGGQKLDSAKKLAEDLVKQVKRELRV
ncbi:MAG: AAA family ATPase [Bdellovibrionota bacterium]